MSEKKKETEDLRSAAAARVEQATAGEALIPAGLSAEEARVVLAETTVDTERAMLEVQEMTERMELELRKEVEEERQALERRVQEMRDEMSAKMREMKEMMKPLEKQMERAKEGIWTVNLYLGSEEQIVQLREGAPAPVEEHVRVRQLVLAMDQEAAVAAEEGGIDSLDIEEFDAWLRESWEHVTQIIPEEKGVVALVPRWDEKTHWGEWVEEKNAFGGVMKEMRRQADKFKTAAAAEGNEVTYFVIRNGQNIYRIAMGDFYAGARLMPSQGEWESFFETNEDATETGIKATLVPGTEAWAEAEEKADYRKRHYMRVGLILQGLADRTEVFSPVPAKGVLNFLAESEYVDMVMDADLSLGTGRQSYKEWHADANRDLRPGERVVLAVESEGFQSHKYKVQGSYDKYGHHRLYPLTIPERPVTGELYEVKGRKGRGLTIQFDRVSKKENEDFYLQKQRWQREGADPKTRPSRFVEKQVKATCTVYPEDSWVLAYDRVSEEEVRYYLNSRIERAAYVEMFPVLKAVLRAKEEERVAEAPFRRVLIQAMVAGGYPPDRAEEDVDELIEWYKFENRRHRALEEDDEKAIRFILAEHGRRVRGEEAPMDETLVALLEDEHPDYLLIGRRRNGRYVVLAPEEEEPWTAEYEYLASGRLAAEKRWTLIAHRADRWRVALEGERWEDWDRDARPAEHISPPERRGLVGAVRHAWGDVLLGARFDREEGDFVFWTFTDRLGLPPEERKISGSVTEPEVTEHSVQWRRDARGTAILDPGDWRDVHSLLYPYSYGYDQETGGRAWKKQDRPGGGSKASGRRRAGRPPWDIGPAYLGVGSTSETERYRKERAHEQKRAAVEAELLYVNEPLLEELYAEEERAEAAKVEEKRLRAVAQRYEAQIKERWVEDRLEEIRAAFWQKHGAEAAQHLWPTHRRSHVKDPSWTYDDGSYRGRYYYEEYKIDRDLSGALERVIEDGFDPEGLTVSQVADLAAYLSRRTWEDDEDTGARRKKRTRKDEEWAWEVPEEVAPMVFRPLDGDAPTGEECPVCGEVHGGDDPDDYHEDADEREDLLPEGKARCVDCDEVKDDPDEFSDGLRCTECVEADVEEDGVEAEVVDGEIADEEDDDE